MSMHMHSCSSYSQKGSRSPLLPAVPSTAATFPLWMAMDSLSTHAWLISTHT